MTINNKYTARTGARTPFMVILNECSVLQVMSKCGVKTLVFSSSSMVYGEPQFLPVTEEHPTGHCDNPYGKTKYILEEILKNLITSDKVCSVINILQK